MSKKPTKKPSETNTKPVQKQQAKTQAASQPSPELIEQIEKIRAGVRENFGKAAMAMMMLPRYRTQTIGDLQHLVLEPLMRDRLAMAYPGKQDKEAAKPAKEVAPDMLGFAIWASVSDDVDRGIREQIKSGVFPVRLKPEDWKSGENNWLLDVVAPTSQATASVIANFRQVVKEGSLALHPVITRLVDKETLEKMGATKLSEDERLAEDVPDKVPENETIN